VDRVSDQNRDQFFDLVDYLNADSNISNRRIVKYTMMYKTLFQTYIDFNAATVIVSCDYLRENGGINTINGGAV